MVATCIKAIIKFVIMSKSVVGQTVFFLASCKAFNGGIADSQGKMPVVLNPIAGESPRGLNIISGTSAELQGFEPGKCYGVKAIEQELYTHPEGHERAGQQVRSFNFDSVGEIGVMEAMREAKSNKPTYLIQPEGAVVPAEQASEEIEANA